MSRLSRSVLTFGLALTLGCSSDPDVPTIPSPPPAPPDGPATPLSTDIATVATTLDLGVSPLRGEVSIDPERSGLRYALDLDDDGDTEEAGPVGLGLRVGYAFGEPGPHRIEVLLDSDDERFVWTRTVVVDDPDADRLVRSRRVEDIGSADLVGIASDEARNAVYLSAPFDSTLVRLTADELEEVWRLRTRFTPGAMVLAPGGDELYVAGGDSIFVIDVSGSDPRVTGTIAGTDGTDLRDPLLPGPRGSLLWMGDFGLLRVDPGSGQVRRLVEEGRIIRSAAAQPGGDRIVAFSTFRLRMFRGPESTEAWVIPVPTGAADRRMSPRAVAFSPAGDRIYGLFFDRIGDTWQFLVLDLADGRTLSRRTVSPPTRLAGPAPVLPTTSAGGGRFVVLSSSFGAFVVDGSDHRPVFLVEGESGGCCQVASTDRGTALVFIRHDVVRRVEIDR